VVAARCRQYQRADHYQDAGQQLLEAAHASTLSARPVRD
jgi:hypothetical protein